jgi:hypothetical protein
MRPQQAKCITKQAALHLSNSVPQSAGSAPSAPKLGSLYFGAATREEFHMSEVSNDDVVAIVGPIGDAAVAEIIGTGISKDELVAAHERAVKDRKAHDPGPPLEPGPFAQVVGILERLHKGGWLGESGSTLT